MTTMKMKMAPPIPPSSAPSSTSTSTPSPSAHMNIISNNSGDAGRSGIDIRDALSILSSRARGGGDADTAPFAVGGTIVPPRELKEMGQTIDMIISDPTKMKNEGNINTSNISGCGCIRSHTTSNHHDVEDDQTTPQHPPMDKDELERHELLKNERTRRGEEIRMQLRSMAVVDLLKMIFRAQEERVATYHLFEEGISTILISGNMTTYPNLCAKVTASFSVLSDTINAVKSSLLANNNDEVKEDDNNNHGQRKEISNFITQLQKSESDKLNLTAALHLERLRLRNSWLSSDDDDGGGGGSEVTRKLLTEGIQSLEHKIAMVVESINEVLEELRCMAAE